MTNILYDGLSRFRFYCCVRYINISLQGFEKSKYDERNSAAIVLSCSNVEDSSLTSSYKIHAT